MKFRLGQLELPLLFRRQHAVDRAQVALNGKLVTYTVKRSARRRAISILVDDRGVRVSAPWDATERAIERLLVKHSLWVLRKLDEWQGTRPAARRWVEGETLMLLGEPLRLALVAGWAGVRLQGDSLEVGTTLKAGHSVSAPVVEWLRDQALICFALRVAHYCSVLGLPGTPEIKLSNARTRWGSCHVSGRIHLNWRLVQMPLRLVDYVVAHEVAHLLEMNHSPRFWEVVGRVVPDYATRRKELRRGGQRYLVL